MRPFRERNPVPIGIVSLLVLFGLLAVGVDAGSIPFLGGGGKTVHAQFSNASGLQTGDDVLMAGVNVGEVKSIKIQGTHVEVGFTVNSSMQLGTQSTAAIKIETLLGKMYVAVTPAGTGSLNSDIPEARTTTPLSVTDAFQGLGNRAGSINAKELAKSFNTIAAAFKGTPNYVHASLRGLSRLSETISSRNNQIRQLLGATNSVSATIASRDAQITKLINDSNLILTTVEQQADEIHSLFLNTSRVAKQLEGLVQDNEAILGPALAKIQTTLHILNSNQANLRKSIELAAPFIRDFGDVVGNGRWFETILSNLSPSGLKCASVQVAGATVALPASNCTGSTK